MRFIMPVIMFSTFLAGRGDPGGAAVLSHAITASLSAFWDGLGFLKARLVTRFLYALTLLAGSQLGGVMRPVYRARAGSFTRNLLVSLTNLAYARFTFALRGFPRAPFGSLLYSFIKSAWFPLRVRLPMFAARRRLYSSSRAYRLLLKLELELEFAGLGGVLARTGLGGEGAFLPAIKDRSVSNLFEFGMELYSENKLVGSIFRAIAVRSASGMVAHSRWVRVSPAVF